MQKPKKKQKREKRKQAKCKWECRANGGPTKIKITKIKTAIQERKERYAAWRKQRAKQKEFITKWSTELSLAQEWLFKHADFNFAYTTWSISDLANAPCDKSAKWKQKRRVFTPNGNGNDGRTPDPGGSQKS